MYKSRYSVLISQDDLARAKSAYKKGNYAMNYFDPLHLKVVEQYLSHLSNEPHNTLEILDEALVRKIINEDSYLQHLCNPEELIPKSFDEVCDFIGSICNEEDTMSLFGKKPTALDIHQYIVQFTAKMPDGTEVKSESMHSAQSAGEAFKKFSDVFKDDDRVEKVDRILMVCEGWRV